VWPGRAYQRFKDAGNMTDRLGALQALVDAQSPLAEPALARFHATFAGDAWPSTSGSCCRPRRPSRWAAPAACCPRAALLQHPDFSLRNPNRVRSLLHNLCTGNPAAFHRADAAATCSGPSKLLELDALNPQLAARLARAMDRWRALAEPYRSAAREAIARVAARPDLSADVREIVTRCPGGRIMKRISLTQYLVEQQREHGRIPASCAC
jgi:aminopeptidase N